MTKQEAEALVRQLLVAQEHCCYAYFYSVAAEYAVAKQQRRDSMDRIIAALCSGPETKEADNGTD